MKGHHLHHFFLGTLRGRLILGVAAVHALMMTLFIVDLTVRQRAMLLDHQEVEASERAETLATSAGGWLAANDIAGLQELVEAQGHDPELLYAILADDHGQILAHTDISRRGQFLTDLPKESRMRTISKMTSLVDVAAPAELGGRQVGWARVGMSQKDAGRKLTRLTISGWLYALVAILIGSVIAWQMGQHLTRRLYAIQETINLVHSGDTLARSAITGTDEAAVMAREFNAMLEVLSQRDRELSEAEARFRKLFDVAPVPLCFVNKDGVLTDFNNRFVQTFGYTHEEVPTLKEWWLLAYPDPHYRQEVIATWEAAVLKAAAEKTDIEPIEYRVTCKSGEVRIMVISGITVDNDVLASFFDVTSRLKSEEELRRSAREWSAAMDASEDVIYLLDLERRIIRANKAFFLLTGTTPETALGRHVIELLHPQGEELPCPICVAQEETRELILTLEADHPDNPAGRPIEITLRIVRDDAGRPISMLMTLHDLTHDRKVQEELTKYREHLEELVKTRTAEIEEKNDELQKINKLFVGRELRMIELKKRIKELEEQAKVRAKGIFSGPDGS